MKLHPQISQIRHQTELCRRMTHRRPPCEHRESAPIRPPGTRKGALLVEMVVCTVVLSLVAAILVPSIHAIQRQRRISQLETLTLIELNNQASLKHMSEPNADSKPQLSNWFATRYPGASLTIENATEAEMPSGDETPVKIMIEHPIEHTGVVFGRSLTVLVNASEAP